MFIQNCVQVNLVDNVKDEVRQTKADKYLESAGNTT